MSPKSSSGPDAAAAEPAHQRDGGRGDLPRLICRRLLGQVVAASSASTWPGAVRRLPDQGQYVSQSELDETVNILNNRVNGLGVSGAEVQRAGNNQISVSIPGVKDAAQVLTDIGKTAQLYFRPVVCSGLPPDACRRATKAPRRRPSRHETISGDGTLPACGSTTHHAANLDVTPNSSVQGYSSNNPATRPAVRGVHRHERGQAELRAPAPCCCPGLPDGALRDTSLRYVLGPAQMTGHSIGSAQAQQNQTGAWEVDYTLRARPAPRCGTRWRRRTSTCCSGSSSTAWCSRPR